MDFYIMNQDLEWLDIVEGAESKVWKKCYAEAAEFEIYTADTPENVDLLQKGRYVVRQDDDMVGIIEKINMQTDDDGRDMLLVSGRCAKALFARRIINKQQTFTGTVWNRMYWMLYNHAVNPSDPNRAIPNTAIADVDDSIKGPSAQTQHTGTNLMTAVIDLLSSNNLGWKVPIVNGKFTATLISGTDRTVDQTVREPVIFADEYDNLISSDYQMDMTGYANVASIAGEGEGSDRTWAGVDATGKASGTYAGLNRYEMYVDARDVQKKTTDKNGKEITLTNAQYKAQLQARGLEKLTEASKTETFTGDVDTDAYTYRTDYNVGDLVTIRDKHGITANTRITAVEEIEDKEGYTVTPTFSDFVITGYTYEDEEEAT